MLDDMRTTLTLDDDILARAREIAMATDRSIGAVISELVRNSLPARPRTNERNGIRLLPPAPPGTVSGTLAEVNQLRDEVP